MSGLRAVFLDIDGVLIVAGQAVPGAATAVRALKERGLVVRFVTNNTRDSRQTLAARLRALDIPAEPDELVSAALATAAYLRQRGLTRCYILARGEVLTEFADLLAPAEEATGVVIGDAAEDFTYENLNRAFRALLRGAHFVAMHRNRYWQTPAGLALDAGAFVRALEYASGRRATVIGKPSPAFFRQALRSAGCPPEAALMVGDDIRTDIQAAQRLGLRTALVQTGKFRPTDLALGPQPDLVLPSVANLPDRLAAL